AIGSRTVGGMIPADFEAAKHVLPEVILNCPCEGQYLGGQDGEWANPCESWGRGGKCCSLPEILAPSMQAEFLRCLEGEITSDGLNVAMRVIGCAANQHIIISSTYLESRHWRTHGGADVEAGLSAISPERS